MRAFILLVKKLRHQEVKRTAKSHSKTMPARFDPSVYVHNHSDILSLTVVFNRFAPVWSLVEFSPRFGNCEP